MEQTVDEFFHDFRQELLAGAEANESFQLFQFVEAVAGELTDTGFVEGYEICHYRAQRGMRVDGYWFDDEGNLDLFIADYESQTELLSLTKTNVDVIFKRVRNFFEAAKLKNLYLDLEDTAPEYGLARQIVDRAGSIRKVNFYLLSERALSGGLQALDDDNVAGTQASFHIWDISRLHRQKSSRGHKEALDIEFIEEFGQGVSCLPAHLGPQSYQSYLIVVPATILASLYEKHGSRLLEQNVRCFLQARGNVNKGIRSTILNEPQMFFAYNNGITATAQEVETRHTDAGLELVRIKDLQIVNGGQTTASLFHTRQKDKASLESVFVQMKLSVIDSGESELVVPKISEYANTQNRVNAADFFSNHPFHIRMEEFSRRLWAPAQQGSQRETKWFYERARGQYADAQSNLTAGAKKTFVAERPKPQMFTKTDLAKFENVWDEAPRYVNLGAQKNFAQYAGRIGSEWAKSSDTFNEFYFKRAIARAILFRRTEKLVSAQSWYNGGYRANVVAYTLSLLGRYAADKNKSFNFSGIWNQQSLSSAVEDAIAVAAELVHGEITLPPQGISNVTEWCKKDACWERLLNRLDQLHELLPDSFKRELVGRDQVVEEKKSAAGVQKIDDGIACQRRVLEITAIQWRQVLESLSERQLLSQKESSILQIATQIPNKIPSERQCVILVELLGRAAEEGVVVSS